MPASLLWRRFSPTRSFDLPVLQLEGLAGEPRSQRLIVLSQRNAGGATWLTVVGVHLEMALWAGFAMLLYLLIPAQNEIDWNWQSLLDPEAGEWLWLEHLSNLLYVLVLVVWEPIYVACGFTLYLNRRTELEAWDIELVFRRLRQRLVGSAYVLLLGLAASLAWLPAPSAYAEPAAAASAGDAELPPEQARLLRQKLNSEQAGKQIRAIVDGAPFKNSETVTGWRFGDKTEKGQPQGGRRAAQGILRGPGQLGAVRHAAQVIEVLLWALLFSAVFLLVWRYREWLRLFVGNLGLPQRARREAPTVMFGLDLSPESLPDDIAGNAERLWNEKPREALGLLYRGLLSRLLHDYRLPLKGSPYRGRGPAPGRRTGATTAAAALQPTADRPMAGARLRPPAAGRRRSPAPLRRLAQPFHRGSQAMMSRRARFLLLAVLLLLAGLLAIFLASRLQPLYGDDRPRPIAGGPAQSLPGRRTVPAQAGSR